MSSYDIHRVNVLNFWNHPRLLYCASLITIVLSMTEDAVDTAADLSGVSVIQ